MATTAKTKLPQRLCCVSIDYHCLLLPADKGRKLVELLEDAVHVRQQFDGGAVFVMDGRAVQVEYTSVKPDQVRAAANPSDLTGRGSKTLQLDHNPGFGAVR